jgi:hypothetical protein
MAIHGEAIASEDLNSSRDNRRGWTVWRCKTQTLSVIPCQVTDCGV